MTHSLEFYTKYKLTILLLLYIFATSTSTFAQRENVWNGVNTAIDFNTTPPTIIQKPGFNAVIPNFGEAAASVCDENGQLLFFTDGTLVHDRNNNIMPNANTLNPIPSTTIFTATSSCAQGTLIVPDPGNDNRYYVFSMYSLEQQANRGRLYYSVIDMTLNGGMGDVVAAEKGILVSTGNTERMTAVRGNQCNVWIITVGEDGKMRSFSLDANGINTNPVITDLALPYSMYFVGKLAVSPNREKIAIGTHAGPGSQRPGILLGNFDPSTGTANSFLPTAIDTSVYGLAFSPNNQYLYFLSEGDYPNYPGLAGKKDAYATTSASLSSSTIIIQQPIQWASDLKTAPDGNIYFNHQGAGLAVPLGHSRIENPNAAGMLSTVNVYALSYSYANGQTPWQGMGLPNVIVTVNRDTTTQSVALERCKTDHLISAQNTTGVNYVWHDGFIGHSRTDLNTSGTYWVAYTMDGCATLIDTIHLTILENTLTHLYDTVCNSEIYSFNNQAITEPGIYTDTFTAANSCDSIIVLHLQHYPAVPATFSSSMNGNLCLGEEISFNGPEAKEYQWSLNKKIVDTNPNFHIKLQDFSTEVSLTITDINGCMATAQQTVTAVQCCEIKMPNAFSPNGDGQNDVFKPIPIKPCVSNSMSLLIYNRWGQKVFQAYNDLVYAGWDGSFNGLSCDVGVYAYLLTYTIKGSTTTITVKGDLTLIK